MKQEISKYTSIQTDLQRQSTELHDVTKPFLEERKRENEERKRKEDEERKRKDEERKRKEDEERKRKEDEERRRKEDEERKRKEDEERKRDVPLKKGVKTSVENGKEVNWFVPSMTTNNQDGFEVIASSE